jgi:DNA gyrase subunit B
VRGKILNCLKADYEAIFKNEIIVDLIKVLGLASRSIPRHNKDLSSFDLDGLRWSKSSSAPTLMSMVTRIRTLILAMLYRLTPTLLDKEKIFIAESPL